MKYKKKFTISLIWFVLRKEQNVRKMCARNHGMGDCNRLRQAQGKPK